MRMVDFVGHVIYTGNHGQSVTSSGDARLTLPFARLDHSDGAIADHRTSSQSAKHPMILRRFASGRFILFIFISLVEPNLVVNDGTGNQRVLFDPRELPGNL